MLRESRAHQQASVAASDDGEFGWLGILALNKVRGAGREIVEYVLLLSQLALRMPFFAILSAAAQIRLRDYHATLEQRSERREIAGSQTNAVAAVACEQHRMTAIQRQFLAMDDIQEEFSCHPSRTAKSAYHLELVQRNGRRCVQRGRDELMRSGVEAEVTAGIEVAGYRTNRSDAVEINGNSRSKAQAHAP